MLGLGNVLLGDDGIGPRVAFELESRFDLPPELEVLDLGTPGLNLQPYLHERRGLVLVDAIRGPGPAGEIRAFDRAALLERPPPPRVSPHDLGLKESLRLVELAEGRALPVTLIGVTVHRTEQGTPMSEAVQRALEPAVEAVRAALGRFGVEIGERERPRDGAPWWE